MTPLRTAIVCAVFALSGAAALIFEALFFRLCGLVVGNGVEAVAIVLSAFMLGLAVGNGLAARLGDRIARPFAAYAALELTIGASGLLLVLGLPSLPAVLAVGLRPFLEAPLLLNAIRGLTTFVLVMLPSVAMGATLPILVRALSALDPNFGVVLGRLYGWNTLGAVAGVLATEGILISSLGIRGSALVAAGLDTVAAAAVLALARGQAPVPAATAAASRSGSSSRRRALALVAAFGAGASLLALEVIWFRLFVLLRDAFGWNLAVMLAIVLAGIATGGLTAARWFRSDPNAHRHAPIVALIAGALVAAAYSELGGLLGAGVPEPIEWLYAVITFPVSFASGMLFPMLGRALQARGVPESRATGYSTLANTVGSACGSFAGAFLLLPTLGIERSIFALALGYGAVALAGGLAVRQPRQTRPWPLLWAAFLWVFALATFGFGSFEQRVLAPPGSTTARLHASGHERTLLRDGLTGTIQLFRKDLAGKPHEWALVTDGYSMSQASFLARRYMKLYAYWPAAVHPGLEQALLISYGVGNTAEALVEQASLQHIDVVDISRDILEVTAMRFPAGGDPLSDPRVEVHVEDGRFFLQATPRRYDLITAEPPPPRVSGVESLYTREHFELIHDRLREGGIVTYWLPVYQLYEDEAKSVLSAFCTAFESCSLWIGTGVEWMMVGVKDPWPSPTLDSFTSLWRDPQMRQRLVDIGLREPYQLGALYIADGDRLRSWIGDAAPLDDDHPHRIRPFAGADLQQMLPRYHAFMSSPEISASFRSSETIERLLPQQLRDATLDWLPHQRLIELFNGRDPDQILPLLHRSFADERLAPYRAWLFGLDSVAAEILEDIDVDAVLRDETSSELRRLLVGRALAIDDLVLAERLLAASPDPRRGPAGPDARLQVYLLLRLDERDAALARLAEIAVASRGDLEAQRALRAFWLDAKRWFDFEQSFEAALRRGEEVRRARSQLPANPA